MARSRRRRDAVSRYAATACYATAHGIRRNRLEVRKDVASHHVSTDAPVVVVLGPEALGRFYIHELQGHKRSPGFRARGFRVRRTPKDVVGRTLGALAVRSGGDTGIEVQTRRQIATHRLCECDGRLAEY